MAYLNDRVLDNGLSALTSEGNKLTLCTQLPATYTEANTTYAIANKTAPTIGSPAARSPSGRKVTISAITDGNNTASGTATHWAIVDTVNSRLLAASSLSVSQAIIISNVFTLTAFEIAIPGPL